MRRDIARPFRNSGLSYIPKKQKVELSIQLKFCTWLRDNYPHITFHSDYAANADLSKNQQIINSRLQSGTGFPDIIIIAKGRVNKKTGKPYTGLAIELKADGTTVILTRGQLKGSLTSNPHIRHQARILRNFIDEGWYANFAVGLEAATAMVDWYFERPHRVGLFQNI